MEYYNKIHHQEKVEVAEEAEEALPLNDLPLNFDEAENKHPLNAQHHPSSTEPSDLFEFFSDLDSEMSHEEDIFFCGRLVSFKDQALANDHHKLPCNDGKLKGFHSRRCESLSELEMMDRSNSTNTRLMRNCRSLDYRKIHRSSSLNSATPYSLRALSDKSSEKSDASVLKVSKPRWYILMFGLEKIPSRDGSPGHKKSTDSSQAWNHVSVIRDDSEGSRESE